MAETSTFLERPRLGTAQPVQGNRLGSFCIFAAACICTLWICASSWPGFMSFDSLETLRQARYGITTNGYPTIVVYMQRLFDAILPGPGLLFAFQVGLYLFSCAAIFVALRVRLFIGLSGILFLTFSPAIVGLLLVVWKDIGMAGFLAFAIASALHFHKTKSRVYLGLALGGLFVATAYRLNGICATIPLLIWMLGAEFRYDRKRLTSLLCASIAVLVSGTVMLNKYRLPDFKPLNSHIEAILYAFDLIGLSERTKQNLIPSAFIEQYPAFGLSDVHGVYFVPHGGRSWYADPNEPNRKILSPKAITEIQSGDGIVTRVDGTRYSVKQMHEEWLHAIAKHPLAYIKHRYDVDRAFLGIGAEVPWGITYPRIDPNNLGVSHRETGLTKLTNTWLAATQKTAFAFPWFYYAMGIVAAVYIFNRRPRLSGLSVALLCSSFLLLLPMLFITASSEQRYHLWSMVAVVLSVIALSRGNADTTSESTSR